MIEGLRLRLQLIGMPGPSTPDAGAGGKGKPANRRSNAVMKRLQGGRLSSAAQIARWGVPIDLVVEGAGDACAQ